MMPREHFTPPSKQAFSLVELSIVLVILGLLAGGILAGKSLIRASELRAVTSEYHRYVTATQAFRDKYFALPGDLTNATSIWGSAHTTAATCVTTAGTGTQTCNGNGDGRMYPSTGSNESFRSWQHLVNAGLIEGVYDGITHGSTNYSATVDNSPSSKIANAGWFTWYWGSLSGDPATFDGDYSRFYLLGGFAADQAPSAGVLLPEEAWNIDAKIDDGQPATGKMVARTWTQSSCVTASSASDTSATYKLTGTTKACALVFRQIF